MNRMLALLAVTITFAGGAAVRCLAQEPPHGNEAADHKDAEKQAPSGDHGLLRIDHETQELIGLIVTEVRAARIEPAIKALGVLEEDPAQSFTVRSPIAGYLRTSGGGWPALGKMLEDHADIGGIQPRLTAVEQFDLTTQYAEAQAAVAEGEAELQAARASFEGKRKLNDEGKMVSDRLLEEAEAKVKISEARIAAAQRKLALLERRRGATEAGVDLVPLRVEHGGQVVELLAGENEVVESGQSLLRVARFDRLIARIELPIGKAWGAPDLPVRIVLSGRDDLVLSTTTIGPAARSGSRTRGESWLLAVSTGGQLLRPGAPVIAYVPRGGPALDGVFVPRSSLVRYGGRTWVFVRTGEDEFERRDVELHSPTKDGWFVSAGLRPGEKIVQTGAQVLLSEQLKIQIEREAEAEE